MTNTIDAIPLEIAEFQEVLKAKRCKLSTTSIAPEAIKNRTDCRVDDSEIVD